MDYKQKYLKYLKKYNNLVGGADPEFERILRISKQEEDEIQRQRQQQEIELQKAMRESMKPVFRREERAMEAAAGPAPDELERILLLSKQEEEQRKLQFKEKQKLELQQALLLSEEMFKLDLHPLEKFKWFKDQNTIKSINKDIILLIDDLIKKGNFLDEYEVNEDQILETAIQLIESLENSKGVASINWHVRMAYPNDPKLAIYGKIYLNILNYLSEKEAIWVTSFENYMKWHTLNQ